LYKAVVTIQITIFSINTPPVKTPPTVATMLAALMPCKYENIIVVLKTSEMTAMLKYMYVGHVMD
jgi:hypothetical protein